MMDGLSYEHPCGQCGGESFHCEWCPVRQCECSPDQACNYCWRSKIAALRAENAALRRVAEAAEVIQNDRDMSRLLLPRDVLYGALELFAALAAWREVKAADSEAPDTLYAPISKENLVYHVDSEPDD